MKKNKLNKRFYLLLAVCILAGFIIAYAIYSQYIVVEVREIGMDMMVMDHIGVNAASDALHFGGVKPGEGSGVRDFMVHNPYDFSIITTAYLSGEMTSWVTISQNGVVIGPGEDAKMKFTATPPATAEYGNYTGKVILVHRRVLW